MEWTPKPINFDTFRQQKPEKGITDEILIVNVDIFDNRDENRLVMEFFDGYAIEKRTDHTPLVLLYPTKAQINDDPELAEAIRTYCGLRNADSIMPYDSALCFGQVFRASDLGAACVFKPLSQIRRGSVITDGYDNYVYFRVTCTTPSSLRCSWVHGDKRKYTSIHDTYNLLKCEDEWFVLFEP